MATYRLRSEVVSAVKEVAPVPALEELVALVQHLPAYKVKLDGLVVKDGYVELEVSGELGKEALEHLNLEAV